LRAVPGVDRPLPERGLRHAVRRVVALRVRLPQRVGDGPGYDPVRPLLPAGRPLSAALARPRQPGPGAAPPGPAAHTPARPVQPPGHHGVLRDPGQLFAAAGDAVAGLRRDLVLGLEPARLAGEIHGAAGGVPAGRAEPGRVPAAAAARPGRAGGPGMSPNTILAIMFGGLTLLMLTGLPIAFVLGGLSLL